MTDQYYVTGLISAEQGSVAIIQKNEEYVLKIIGIKNVIYKFGISLEDDKQLRFEYHFDNDGKLILEQVDTIN